MTRDHSQSPGDLPERVGGYLILGRLGRGGMGEVLSAVDESTGRPVAVKRSRSGTSEALRLEREASALARLRHPTILELYEVVQTPDGPCLVLERVEGSTLAGRLERGPLSMGEVLRWGHGVAQALRVSHAAGVLHRDLKAENVMVDRHGRLKVVDWGLAKDLRSTEGEDSQNEGLTSEGRVVGTSRAMSPEQALGRELDGRSDLFSLGVLLFEMATGISPFRGSDREQTLHNLTTARSLPLGDLRPEVPRPLAELVDRLLAKDRDRRPPSAAAVERALGEMLDGLGTGEGFWDPRPSEASPIESTQTTERGRGPDPHPRKPTWRRRAIVAFVLVVSTVLYWTMGLWGEGEAKAPPPWVAVVEPRVSQSLNAHGLDADGERLAGLIADATLRAVVEMEDLRAVEPSADGSGPDDPITLGRAAAADEVLSARLSGRSGLAWVDLRRTRVDDGKLLASRRIAISSVAEDALQNAGRIESAVRDVFGRSTQGTTGPQMDEQDYLTFLKIQREVRKQNLAYPKALDRLDDLLARSPAASSALWLAADLAQTLYSDTRQDRYLDRAEGYLERARNAAPEDPRPLIHAARLALLRGRLEEVERRLEELDRTAPGDGDARFCRALWLQATGDYDGAVEALTALVKSRPAKRYLLQLATLEFRTGRVSSARSHLDRVFDLSPNDPWGLGTLLQLELMHGDLQRVEELANRLLDQRPHRSHWTNLGLSRFLLGRYESARRAYLRALELDPDHPTTLLNLADTLQAMGRQEEASNTYRRILTRLEARAETRALSAAETLNKAQCAARLGMSEKAVGLTLEVLAHARQDGEMAYQAALIFNLAGDRTSALIQARTALASGMDARWFRIPALASLAPLLDLEPT